MTRIAFHFRTLAMSSLLYQPTATSFKVLSFLVTVRLRYLVKRSCQEELQEEGHL